jgi:hypothetical protein
MGVDGSRMRTLYHRAYAGRRFGFLVDAWPQPTILDLAAEPASNDDLVEENEGGLWPEAIRKRTKWPKPAVSAHLQSLDKNWSGHSWESDDGNKGVVTFANIENVPKDSSGLYLIIWPHGAYLGMSKLSSDKSGRSNQGIYGRVAKHRRAYEEFSYWKPSEAQKLSIRVYWLKIKPNADVASIEKAYLNRILGQPLPSTIKARVAEYREKGFRNLQELEQPHAAD